MRFRPVCQRPGILISQAQTTFRSSQAVTMLPGGSRAGSARRLLQVTTPNARPVLNMPPTGESEREENSLEWRNRARRSPVLVAVARRQVLGPQPPAELANRRQFLAYAATIGFQSPPPRRLGRRLSDGRQQRPQRGQRWPHRSAGQENRPGTTGKKTAASVTIGRSLWNRGDGCLLVRRPGPALGCMARHRAISVAFRTSARPQACLP